MRHNRRWRALANRPGELVYVVLRSPPFRWRRPSSSPHLRLLRGGALRLGALSSREPLVAARKAAGGGLKGC
eukprot:scaffold71204_cov57-Phaeocystis_antarctica.AAC.3